MIYRLLYKLLHDSANVRDRVGTRIFANNAPAKTQGECIIMRSVSGTAQKHLTNESDCANRIVQIDFYGANSTDAEGGWESIRMLLSGYSGSVDVLNSAGTLTSVKVSEISLLRPGAEIEEPQDASDRWTYRFSGDFEVFHSQDVPTHE